MAANMAVSWLRLSKIHKHQHFSLLVASIGRELDDHVAYLVLRLSTGGNDSYMWNLTETGNLITRSGDSVKTCQITEQQTLTPYSLYIVTNWQSQ